MPRPNDNRVKIDSPAGARRIEHLGHHGRRYVLLTAAYDEEAHIESAIKSVLSQTLRPERWVVVSDGSTDGTDKIIQSYAKQVDWIRFLRVSRAPGRSFSSKVIALRTGSKMLEEVQYEFVGNMDADVSLGPSYFEGLIAHFESYPSLGIAAGLVYEQADQEFRSRKGNRIDSVAHAAQLVRRECYEAIGGYAVLDYGGEDWHAQICAKMKGWTARAFPELKIYHHRETGTGDNLLRHRFREGRMDHSFGSHPLFEVLKCTRRLSEAPFVVGGAARLVGFAWSYLCRSKRPVSNEFVQFLRGEQMQAVRSLLTESRH